MMDVWAAGAGEPGAWPDASAIYPCNSQCFMLQLQNKVLANHSEPLVNLSSLELFVGPRIRKSEAARNIFLHV